MSNNFKSEVIAFIRSIGEQHGIEVLEKKFDGVYADLYLPKFDKVLLFHSIVDDAIDPRHTLHRINMLSHSIPVVHIWEDQWIFQQDKLKSRIVSMLGFTRRIHGRETKVVKLDNGKMMKFLLENHMNVAIKAQYKYGLELEGELFAMMSFSKGRKMFRGIEEYNSYELLRFCNKMNITVVGGFTKLLNHFIKSIHPDDVMTYVDADWSDGKTFNAIGFDLIEEMPGMEFWLNSHTGEREYPHLAIIKQGKSMDLMESDMEKTNFLVKNGYRRVYNSGSYKYVLLRK